MTARLRPALESLPAYVPGKNIPGAIKLASNETTDGPLPSAREAIATAVADLNRYPDNGAMLLKEALAKFISHESPVSVENIAVGCGSVSLCQQLVQLTAGEGDEVLFAWRSFETYPLATKLAGATPVQVPLTADHVHDLDAMAAAITDRTRLIFVCNPNNPTGTVVDPAELRRFLNQVPNRVLVALDEAYIEYVRDSNPHCLELLSEFDNLVILRTFSKAYGLAGLRVGYAIAAPYIISALGKSYVPFSVSTLAQAAAIASLDASSELLSRTDAVAAERERVASELIALGYSVPPSQANFVWIAMPTGAAEFAEFATNNGVIVRPFADAGVRVTVTHPAENDAFLQVARQYAERA